MTPVHRLSAILGSALFWFRPFPNLIGDIVGQSRTGTVVVTVQTAEGRPLPGSRVSTTPSADRLYTDSLGMVRLDSLPAGPVRVLAMSLGYAPRDTTVIVVAGQVVSWKAVLQIPDWVAIERKEYARFVAAGGLDSVAAGLLEPEASGAASFASFGIDFLRAEVARSNDSNHVFSPVSAGQALGLLLLAARDSTARAIAGTLRLGAMTAESLAVQAGRFNRAIRARADVKLLISNALWADTSAILAPEFVRGAADGYDALAKTIPLHGTEAPRLINRWADSATGGRIPAVISEPFESSIRVVVTNATWFRGDWLSPFDSSATRERPFTTASGAQLLALTMDKTSSWAYRRGDGFQALRLPYRAGLTAMYLVLPDSGMSPRQLLETVEEASWPIPDPRTETRLVHLQLPRLRMELDIDLRPSLTALGAGIAFDSARADFQGLVALRPWDPPWCPPFSSEIVPEWCTRYRVAPGCTAGLPRPQRGRNRGRRGHHVDDGGDHYHGLGTAQTDRVPGEPTVPLRHPGRADWHSSLCRLRGDPTAVTPGGKGGTPVGIVSLLLVLSSPFSIRSQQGACPEVLRGRPVPFCRLDTGAMPLTGLIPPVYPPVLDQAGISGTVRLEFIVDSSGQVGAADLRVISGSNRAFQEPARRAILAHRFAVPRLAGKPVSAVVQLVVEFMNGTDSVPTRPVASHEVTVWGYAVRIEKEPVPRSLPPPALSPEDSIAALRVALLAEMLPASAEVGRALCVSVRGKAPDPEALAVLRAQRPTTVPPQDCPPTYATSIITSGSKQRPPGALDPDFLRIGGLTAWTPDLVVVYVTHGRGPGGTSYVCDVARVQEPSGWRVVQCRNHRRWVS